LIQLIIEASVVDLPEPSRPGDEDEAAGALEHVLHDERQAELLERERRRRQQAEHHAVTAVAAEGVGAGTRAVAEGEGEVAAAVGVEVGASGRPARRRARGLRPRRR
jgi:hypothetical protein